MHAWRMFLIQQHGRDHLHTTAGKDNGLLIDTGTHFAGLSLQLLLEKTPGHRQDKSAYNCQMHEDRHTDITSAPDTGNFDRLRTQSTLPKERRGRFNEAFGFI